MEPTKVQTLVDVQRKRFWPGTASVSKKASPAVQVAGAEVPDLNGFVEVLPEISKVEAMERVGVAPPVDAISFDVPETELTPPPVPTTCVHVFVPVHV